MTTVICDGCWVQGDGPHNCSGHVERPGMWMSCHCGVQPDCRSWQTGDERARYAHQPA